MRPRVFCLGLSKTGTSSFRDALKILGYRVTPMNKRIAREVERGETAGALETIDQAEALEDMPWPLLFREIFGRHGTDARYVLTVRTSPEKWLASVKKHQLQGHIEKALFLRWPGVRYRYAFGFEEEYLRAYEAHNASVREFFRANGAGHVLLEACWEDGHGWPELCGLIGCPVPDVPFPHSNADARRPQHRFRAPVHRAAARLYAAWHGRRARF
ncbi:MAG: sulfotransferase family protein [Alphaproteobacteria bacterium]